MLSAGGKGFVIWGPVAAHYYLMLALDSLEVLTASIANRQQPSLLVAIEGPSRGGTGKCCANFHLLIVDVVDESSKAPTWGCYH